MHHYSKKAGRHHLCPVGALEDMPYEVCVISASVDGDETVVLLGVFLSIRSKGQAGQNSGHPTNCANIG
jgi:hypothetical protein